MEQKRVGEGGGGGLLPISGGKPRLSPGGCDYEDGNQERRSGKCRVYTGGRGQTGGQYEKRFAVKRNQKNGVKESEVAERLGGPGSENQVRTLRKAERWSIQKITDTTKSKTKKRISEGTTTKQDQIIRRGKWRRGNQPPVPDCKETTTTAFSRGESSTFTPRPTPSSYGWSRLGRRKIRRRGGGFRYGRVIIQKTMGSRPTVYGARKEYRQTSRLERLGVSK